jgi:hypothetical protein
MTIRRCAVLYEPATMLPWIYLCKHNKNNSNDTVYQRQ